MEYEQIDRYTYTQSSETSWISFNSSRYSTTQSIFIVSTIKRASERASEGVHVIWQLIEELICQCNESILMEWLWLCLWRVSIWDTHNNLIKYPLCCVHATADYYLTVTFFCLVELLNPSIQTLIENSAHFILEIMCECVSGSEPKKYNTYSSWNRGEERKGKVDKTACSDLNKYFNVEPATMNG